ncbi:Basic secretory protease [Thalictrum thalictroides]|uniref:Basic secretory protease n=1 Tax=Thalictrum thalictroides TaxID=46969 RepID=A0A7J6V4Q5_THATH|nr:Basic secretory protease [Thalictrum thalictroides]
MILTSLQGTHAVQYKASNTAGRTPGGTRFTNEIDIEYNKRTLVAASGFIWRTFRQTRLADRKDVQLVSMFVDDMDGVAYALQDTLQATQAISLRAGFVVELNAKMRTGYSNNFFYDLLGKTVDQLWSDYKAKYQN